MSNAPESRIEMYFHCKTCTDLEELKSSQKLAAGWTPEGLQVVCENCGQNIIDIDFMGQKVAEYQAPEEEK